ncbi:hypothetical protein LCGC14_2192190 [marine sediment metagenome]|uniref:Uncharacterized protein n=1 Tax=marine sediment metagenome TaxID=412755 RepID=A0A0F9DJF0_9ZZZZ
MERGPGAVGLSAVEDVVLDAPPGDNETVLLPMRRSELKMMKAIRFTEQELETVERFQLWLATTINPETSKPFIEKNTFTALIRFCLNSTFTQMGVVATEMAGGG